MYDRRHGELAEGQTRYPDLVPDHAFEVLKVTTSGHSLLFTALHVWVCVEEVGGLQAPGWRKLWSSTHWTSDLKTIWEVKCQLTPEFTPLLWLLPYLLQRWKGKQVSSSLAVWAKCYAFFPLALCGFTDLPS